MTPFFALLIAASLASPAALAPSAAPSTSGPDPTTTPSPAASPESSPTLASPTATVRRTPRPTATPAAEEEEPTPDETSAAPVDDDPSSRAPTQPATQPTSAPAAAVRAFRTPERAAPPAFVAPQIELPASGDDAPPPDQAETEPMPAPDEPYEATVTFRAVGSPEVTGFGLMVIYPRSDGDFVGSGSGTECRAPGDAALFADDNDQGMLRVRVTGTHPLAFPLDVVCRFTVDPNAVLQARVIAVNVVDVVTTSGPGAASAVAVSVLAH